MQTAQEVSLRICELFLSTAAKWATQSDAHLDLLFPKEEELVRDVKTSVCLCCSDHEIVVSQILLGRAALKAGLPQVPRPVQGLSLSPSSATGPTSGSFQLDFGKPVPSCEHQAKGEGEEEEEEEAAGDNR